MCDGKVVLRLTDEQHWISPRGKLKKHEMPSDAVVHEAVEELCEAGTSRAAVTAGGVAMRYVPDPPSPEPGPPEPAPQPPSPEPPDPIEVTSS